ncbi:DUF5082 family protein [Pseudogracilibacillus sp. SO30301A]|uniref:DUF5082 family protein n=1 Tax=Pseudogracilibacillus sp. SO30301A TaxID=3098291 RepID=UPI00300E49C5
MGERAELQQQYSAKQSELNVCYVELNSLEDRINRLEALKKEFVTLKTDANQLKQDLTMETFQFHEYWQGQLFGEYERLLAANLIHDGMTTYIKNIDTNLDELNNELMRLQNEVYSTEGIIGSIKSSLNWLTTKIENLIN